MDIKALRAQIGMNRTKFSEFLGIPPRSVQNWEVGERSCPAYIEKWIEKEVREQIERTTPVPLEKLRDMFPDPVWVRSKHLNGWYFVHGVREYESSGEVLLLIDRAGRVADFPVAEYGKSWSAYSRKPQ